MFYQKILRPILFKTDPEWIHDFTSASLGFISRQKLFFNPIKNFLFVDNEILHTTVGKINFLNPIGLAAGFDKNIGSPLAYPMLGFGFAELGSITYRAQAGNPKPRLWRLPDDNSLIVYYGLANCGAKVTKEKMEKMPHHFIPYGISIAPTTGLSVEEMADDYCKSFSLLHPYGDYVTLNVSCPNVTSCETFVQFSFIKELAQRIKEICQTEKIDKDIYLKIGSNLSPTGLDKIIEICLENNITGVVATNLLKDRTGMVARSSAQRLDHPGGISGKLLVKNSNEIIKYIRQSTKGKLKIIGLGGVFTAQDAYEKIKLGADLIQMITGFIYNGPLAVKHINLGLIKLLQKDGFKNISEAVGKDVS